MINLHKSPTRQFHDTRVGEHVQVLVTSTTPNSSVTMVGSKVIFRGRREDYSGILTDSKDSSRWVRVI